MNAGFIGAGRTASALAIGLVSRGYAVRAISSRGSKSARELATRIPGCHAAAHAQDVIDAVDVVFLAVPDDALASLVAGLRWRSGAAAVHCSGALGLEALAPASAAGAQIGALHPLQTFGDRSGTATFTGTTFAVEGDEPLIGLLEAMARDLGGEPLRLPPGSRALYHAAAVLVSNYVVTLADQATQLWQAFGTQKTASLKALLPLLSGTVANLERLGLPGALTGPIARGDAETIRTHLQAIQESQPQIVELYRTLGLLTVPIALEGGTIGSDQAARLTTQLQAERSERV